MKLFYNLGARATRDEMFGSFSSLVRDLQKREVGSTFLCRGSSSFSTLALSSGITQIGEEQQLIQTGKG